MSTNGRSKGNQHSHPVSVQESRANVAEDRPNHFEHDRSSREERQVANRMFSFGEDEFVGGRVIALQEIGNEDRDACGFGDTVRHNTRAGNTKTEEITGSVRRRKNCGRSAHCPSSLQRDNVQDYGLRGIPIPWGEIVRESTNLWMISIAFRCTRNDTARETRLRPTRISKRVNKMTNSVAGAEPTRE